MHPKYLYGAFLLMLLTGCAANRHTARIVLLPDTQTYAEKFPEVLEAQTKWLDSNAKNIDFVLQQGDLTQNNNDREWKLVKQAFEPLNHKLPYVLAVGNHDMGSAPGKFADTRNTDMFDRYFPPTEMATLPGFFSSYEPGSVANAAYTFKTGRINWMVLTLEFGPRNAVLDWANQLVRQHPEHTVILNTHSYMYFDSTRQGPSDNWRPQGYGVGKDTGSAEVNDGEQIWNKLVRKHPNIRFIFSGHILNTGVGNLVSIDDAGLPVYQMLANYQQGVKGSVKGGNGFLRILEMDFKKKTLKVATYSPYIHEFKEETDHSFFIRNVPFSIKNSR